VSLRRRKYCGGIRAYISEKHGGANIEGSGNNGVSQPGNLALSNMWHLSNWRKPAASWLAKKQAKGNQPGSQLSNPIDPWLKNFGHH